MRTPIDKDRIALIVAFAAILAVPGVQAQSVGTTVIADIPFCVPDQLSTPACGQVQARDGWV